MTNTTAAAALVLAAALSGTATGALYAQGRDSLGARGDRGPSAAGTETAFVVDEAAAQEGAKVWRRKGCDVCHGIGQGKLAGPDLQGVTERHNQEWLHEWIRNPTAMAENDPVAGALVKGYNNIVMPDLGLSNEEVTAVINYIARESQDKGSSSER